MNPNFTILITTKNRISDLRFTLENSFHLMNTDEVKWIVCDDGSTDGTSDFVKENYPNIQLIRNTVSKGLIYSRNSMLDSVTTKYAISLDDDLNFLSEKPLATIANFFEEKPECGVQSFRIYWDKNLPTSQNTTSKAIRVNSFAGGAHAFRMVAWRAIPNYPSWFMFYGEEDFASYHLFKKGWEVYYNPQILTHHRVNLKDRKNNKDYLLRYRRSLRSGWYLYFLFYPWLLLPRKLAYSFFMQIKLRFFKERNFKFLVPMLQAIGDVFFNLPRLLKKSNRLSLKEFKELNKLQNVTLYWTPNDEK